MASQYSILRQYSPYVSPYNIDLIKEAMLYKQGKVDANRAAINRQIDYLMGQDLAKEEDREYLQNRVSDTLARVNEMYAGADLSSDGIARHIQSEVSTILDDNVINAVAGTAEMRRMQAHLEEIQKDNMGAYSDMNAYVAMKPAMRWLNDGKAGTKLGPLNYTPYTDYNKELNDLMMDIRSKSGATKYFEQVKDAEGNPTGDIIETSRDQMSAEQIAAIAMNGLSDKARRQMQIEAEFMADSNPEMFSYQNMMSYAQSDLNRQRDRIAAMEAEKMGYTKDTTQYRMLESQINDAKSSLIRTEDSLRSITPENYNPIMGAQMVVETNFKNGAALKWAYDKTSYELKSDESYWNRMNLAINERNYNLQYAKFQFDVKKWQSEFEYRRQKDAYEAQRKERELGFDMSIEAAKTQSGIDLNNARTQKLLAAAAAKGAGATGGRAGSIAMSNAVAAGTGYGIITRGEVKDLSNSNVNEMIGEDFSRRYSEYNANMARLINNLDPEDVKKIDKYIEEQSKNPTTGYAGLSRNDAYLRYFKQNGSLSNEAFVNAKKGQNGAKGSKIAQDAYLAASDSYQKLSIHNERIEEEKKIYGDVYGKVVDEIRQDGYSGDVLDRKVVKTILKDVLNVYSDMNKYDFWLLGPLGSGEFAPSKRGIFRPEEISYIHTALISTFGDRYGKEISVYDLFETDPETGNFKLKDIPVSVDNGFFIQDRTIDESGVEQDSLLKQTYLTLKDWMDPYRSRDLFTEVRGIKSGDVNERTVDVRKKYLAMNIPKRISIYAKNSNDKDYEAVVATRALYNSKNGKAGDIDGFNIDHVDTSENGGLNYKITPIGQGLTEDDAVEVVFDELYQTGIITNMNEQNQPIGFYKSGIIKVSFADPNNKDYVDLLESNNISGVYASKPDLKNHLSGIIVSRLSNNLSLITDFMQDPQLADKSKAQIETLVNAVSTIINNAEKLGIDINGFDTQTKNTYGFDTTVYKLNSSNPNARPEEVLSVRTKNVFFADSVDRELMIAPQYRLSLILEDALVAAINNMTETGATSLDESMDLTKILKAVQ